MQAIHSLCRTKNISGIYKRDTVDIYINML